LLTKKKKENSRLKDFFFKNFETKKIFLNFFWWSLGSETGRVEKWSFLGHFMG
jgi:hypothetical protein